jgi:hypothetical protein
VSDAPKPQPNTAEPLSPSPSASLPANPSQTGGPPADLERLRDRLLDCALYLAASLVEDGANAPLNQRAAALGLVIDRLLKLAVILPASGAPTLRIEYVDTHDHARGSPPWTDADPAQPGTLHGAGVRAPLREDGTGEDRDPASGA